MTDDEARAEIVRYSARLWERRSTSGNLSVKLDDGDLLVTPAQRALADLDVREIVRVDADGRARDGSQRSSSELPLHLAAYAARPDARCVMHTHPTFCVVWSRTGRIFAQDTVGARETLGPVAFAPYRPPGSAELARLCSEVFKRGIDTVLMERHGLSVVAATLEAAFVLTDLAEEAARIAYFSAIASQGGEFTSA